METTRRTVDESEEDGENLKYWSLLLFLLLLVLSLRSSFCSDAGPEQKLDEKLVAGQEYLLHDGYDYYDDDDDLKIIVCYKNTWNYYNLPLKIINFRINDKGIRAGGVVVLQNLT